MECPHGYLNCNPCNTSKAARELATLREKLAAAERERDEAREWVRRLHRESQVLTCVYCGQAYPPGTPASGAEALTEHVKVCPKHPLAQMRGNFSVALTLLEANAIGWRAAGARDVADAIDGFVAVGRAEAGET